MKPLSAASLRGRRTTAPETVASARNAPRSRAARGNCGAAATILVATEAAPAPAAESVAHAPTRSATASTVRKERNPLRPALDTSAVYGQCSGMVDQQLVDEAATQ